MEQVTAHFRKFLVTLLILTVVLIALFVVAFEVIHIANIPSVAYIFFPYFFTLTAIIHHILLKASQQKGNQFINKFTGLLGIKMFLSAAVVGIFAYLFKEQIAPIVIMFLILYFSYTFTEVAIINKVVRTKPKQSTE